MTQDTPPPVWLVTGCSSGFGAAIAKAAIDKGHRVVVTARRPEQLRDLVERAPDRVLALRLDLTIGSDAGEVVRQARERFGRIDVLVNNAGAGLVGAVEECSPGEIEHVYRTNVFGTLDVTRVVLTAMREQGSGHIVFITSIGALKAAPSVGIYNSSKAALDCMAEALAAETRPLGIKVTTFLPGLFKTDFRSRGITRAAKVISDYDATAGAVRSGLETPYPDSAGEPEDAAAAILEVIDSGKAPLRVVLGGDAVRGMEKKIAALQAELDEYRSLAIAHGGGADAMALYKF